jgi:hypothetical protein
MAGRMARGMALAALLASLALASCGARPATGARTTALATATATPTGLLPSFTDWRIAALTNFNTLHVFTLDGKSDLTGPTLDAGAHSLTISPNGRTIAYLTAPKYGPITLLELDAHTRAQSTIAVPIVTANLAGAAWSPDGSQLVVSGMLDGASGLYQVDARTGKPALVPQTGPGGASVYLGDQADIAGWTDATHLVTFDRGATLLLEVATGAASPLALPQEMTIARIAPGGRQALLVAGCGACCTFTPDVAIYDFATGAIRHLPQITAATDGQGPALWQPGTSLAAGVLHPAQRTTFTAALFDLATDTVTPLQPNMIPQAWLPDGQTLLLASHPADGTNGALYLERPVAPTTTPVPLAPNIPGVLGFVRTAGGAAQGGIMPTVVVAAHAPWNATGARAVPALRARPLALPHCG